ncbi:universal stress protein [Blastococcus jejuensis]|uniref:Universal stress protein n=1 Tax=Blastococcus jejuensis TaxID=351224 RepID=A0ABP6PQL5_9ACTN
MSTSAPFAPSDRTDDDSGGGAAPEPRAPGDDEPAGRDVVVGVDGSEVALGAVRWAAREAARRGTGLRIVHAATYLGRKVAAGMPSPELPHARRIAAQAYTVARHTEHDLAATTEVVPAEPIAALMRAAAGSELVVLGSSTTGAADEMVLAPIALRMAARATRPVVVVPRLRGSIEGRPVVAVLGIGDADDDAAVAEFAAAAAERAGVGVSILQTRAPERALASWADDLETWRERFPSLSVERSALPGASAGDVLSAACPSPLLVMSTGQGTLLHRSLDGPHRWLMRHCTSPMALIPQVHRADREPREEIVALG